MALQTTVRDSQLVAIQGAISRNRNCEIDALPNCSVQKETFTVTTADTTTTITLNGTAYTFTETGASESTTVIAAALVTAINAGADAAVLTASNVANVVTVVSDVPGTGFTSAATANCTKAILNHNSGAIDFGLFVCIDSNNTNNCKLPGAATDVTGRVAGGFTILTHGREQTDNGYALNTMCQYLRRGAIWVKAEEAMAKGDTVYVRYLSGTGTTIGAVRNDADSTTCAALDGASVLQYDSTTGLVEIDINLPY